VEIQGGFSDAWCEELEQLLSDSIRSFTSQCDILEVGVAHTAGFLENPVKTMEIPFRQ
jgi:hypothetical protein